jgi:hypothetical protein
MTTPALTEFEKRRVYNKVHTMHLKLYAVKASGTTPARLEVDEDAAVEALKAWCEHAGIPYGDETEDILIAFLNQRPERRPKVTQ